MNTTEAETTTVDVEIRVPAERKIRTPRAKTVVVAVAAPEPDPNAASYFALNRLLAMAQRYRSQGKLREALEMCWEITDDYPDSPAAAAAKITLLELATAYENNGAPRLARSIFERLAALEE